MSISSLLKITTALVLTFFTFDLGAQIVDCNVFLQGKYLEVGINQNGAFGTSVNAPSGYHANTYDTMYNPCTTSFSVPLSLGFMADPSKTGWSSYYGDFIAPLTPNEGWAISDNTGTGYAYASYYNVTGASGFSGPVSGTTTSYSLTGGVLSGVWAGKLTTDSLNIVQTTLIDTGNVYLLQHIVFYNSGTTTIDSFFYLRSVNPHNDFVFSGIPATLNKIKYQLPNIGNLTVVSATGTYDTTAYMELGTKDKRARGFIIRNDSLPPAGSLASIYWGDTAHYKYGTSDTLTENGGIGLIFRIAGMGPGDTISIDYGYSFKGGILDTVLRIDTIITVTLNGSMITQNAKVSVYPNPAGDLINVTGLTPGNQVTIYDVMGRAMFSNQVMNSKTINTFSVANLGAGIYFVVVKDTSGLVLTRVPLRKL